MTPTGLPPGPSGTLRATLRFLRDPIAAIRGWHATYGDTFSVPIAGSPWVFTSDAELAREVYANRDPTLFLAGVADTIDPLFGPGSILRLADEAHNRERKIMLPPFHGERMRAWAQTIAGTTRRTFDPASGAIRALDLTRRVTLDVILRVIFGVRDDARVAAFHAAIDAWTAAIRPSFIFFPALAHDWLGLSPYARYRQHSERLDRLLREQIAAARADPVGTDDVLSMLVHARYDDGTAMDDQGLRDNLRTLLFAGHDTTAITLAWALWFVFRDPAIRARLQEALDALGPDVDPDALTRVPLLNAVIDETLRYRPINPETQRRLARPWKLGPWQLPAGATLAVCQLLLHYDERHWDQPYRFSPDRFLGQPPSPWVYNPFGGGNRRCLGAAFARYEAAVVLGTLLREYSFEATDREVAWGRGTLILEPLGGVSLRVRPRVRAAA